MKHNTEIFGRSLNLQPPDGALFINGLYFDVETLDLGLLLETLRTELTVISGLYNNGKINNVYNFFQLIFFLFLFYFIFLIKRHQRKTCNISSCLGFIIIIWKRVCYRYKRYSCTLGK